MLSNSRFAQRTLLREKNVTQNSIRERRHGTKAAHARKQAASGSVVAASELEHGKLRLASSKVRGRRWRAWRWWRR
ncbi:hypothetical protein PR001_g31087 [Phytophthora rubi]|uniref:Uncharacterized protein n=1 Tax=Phytophthora rubi TaxID=129364 RepID=A0A6A3GLQ1_9STRA|nr:hypothetical protein PR001_g31087 [Phytophthora rubi]